VGLYHEEFVGLYHEEFVGLYHVGTIDATCLEHAITDTLLRMGVSLSHCMSGSMLRRSIQYEW
jgi:hypothetical protein